MSGPVAPGSGSWWTTKVRQFVAHVTGRVRADERSSLERWLGPDELALFDRMHRADRRHGLDVVAHLRAAGVDEDRELLVAGLLHDAGKERVGVLPRIVWSLGELGGGRVRVAAGLLPGIRRDLGILERHAERSAELALAAGCSERIARLIREQDRPTDGAGDLLHAADEAS